MTCNAGSEMFEKWNPNVDNSCPVDYCVRVMRKAKEESCGEEVLCREGTWQAYEIIRDITEGRGQSDDLELLKELTGLMKDNAGCEMARYAASICLDSIKEYEEEWDRHISRKRCTNLVCKGSFTLYIDPAICDGCGKCIESCSIKAIVGGQGLIHVIDTNTCVKSMECMGVCPNGAIKKAGPVKPKLPLEPVKVGNFGQVEEDGGGRRRHRRKSS